MVEGYHHRTITYFEIGELELALIDWEMVTKLTPEFVDAQYNAFVVYYTMKLYIEKIEKSTNIMNLDEEYTQAYLIEGILIHKLYAQRGLRRLL